MKDRPRRIWITGVGPVAPLGIGRERFWEAVLEDRRSFARPPALPGGLAPRGPAATLAQAGFSAEAHADPRYVRRLSALSRSALVAAGLALEDAGYPEDPELRNETGVVLGTAFGSASYHFEYYEGLFRHGLKEASPLLFSESVLNAASGHVSQYLRLRGPSLTLVGGEEVGLGAAATALGQMRAGPTPSSLAGGAEEYSPIIHRALLDAGIVQGEAGGAPLGEGAAFLLMEEASGAARRGARPLAEAAGAGWGRAEPEGAAAGDHVAAAVEAALREAEVDPGEVELVLGGGDGGALDRPETLGLRRVLDPARPVRLVLPKRNLGEGFGFSSAAQLLLGALALATGRIPHSSPLFGGDTMGGSIPGRPRPLRHALAVSATRRGGACAFVLRRVDR